MNRHITELAEGWEWSGDSWIAKDFGEIRITIYTGGYQEPYPHGDRKDWELRIQVHLSTKGHSYPPAYWARFKRHQIGELKVDGKDPMRVMALAERIAAMLPDPYPRCAHKCHWPTISLSLDEQGEPRFAWNRFWHSSRDLHDDLDGDPYFKSEFCRRSMQYLPPFETPFNLVFAD